MTDPEIILRALVDLIPEFDRKFVRPYHALLKNIMTQTQTKILLFLSQSGRVSMSSISQELDISRPQLTSCVDSLVRDGYLSRMTLENDRRIVEVELTPAAQNFLQKTSEEAVELYQKQFAALPRTDMEELYQSAVRIKQILDKL